ncbi:MAG: hypothetical protein ABEJ85_02545 [Haloarculaceae archaeon]
MPSDERVQDAARERQRERAERTEHIVDHFEAVAEGVTFPTTSAELAAEYRDAPDEVVGEEESLGSVLDRLDDEYESLPEAREAILEELGEAEHAAPADTEREEVAETRDEELDRVESVEGEGEDEDPDDR